MSFIDQIKKRKEAEAKGETTPVTKPNPFARKNPLARPQVNPEEVPVVQEETEASVPVVDQEPAQEVVAEPEVKEEVVEEVAPEPEPTPEPEAKEEVVPEPEAEVEAEVEPEPAPKPKTTRKPRQKKTDEAVAEAAIEATKEPVKEEKKKEVVTPTSFADIPTTDVNTLNEVLQAIKTPFVDEEWSAFKEEIVEELNSITIADDLNPGMLKVTLSELSLLRDKLWLPLQDAKNEYDRFTAKEPEGVIERVKRINSVGGANDTERRRIGILACMNYQTPVGNVNLYEALDDIRERYNFLKAAMDSVKFKSDLLITMNGALKLESSI